MSKKRKKRQKKHMKAVQQTRHAEETPKAPEAEKKAPVSKPKKEAPTAKQTKAKGTSPAKYVNEVKIELKKVSWPSKPEVVTATIIVIIMVVIFGVYTGILDFSFGRLILYLSRIFGKGV